MRAKSVTEQARRAQIVSAAIATIAELDYAETSFKAIAARAGLSSTGLISYHFGNKQELVDAVFADVLDRFQDFVGARLGQSSPREELRAFLAANVAFLRAHRADMLAFLRIRAHAAVADGGIADSDHVELAALLRRGQEAGEFRAFDPDVMAVFVLAMRNGVVLRSGSLDLDVCERELVAAVELATGT
ncbi:TetR/AcrR family transcriptional regulator [Lentzea sp. NPDC059081]|uniref:TetR/AcrR family transcriptional regulator n=1 Tax=Lentzea sp. NPDC059081 TaxID=3346719 RepID=UPI0036B8BEFA